MNKVNVVRDKSFDFALEIVSLYKNLRNKKKEYVLSKQLLRSGTSIGANVEEAQAAQSKKDFLSKMAIASKEARETQYWLKLLIRSGYIMQDDIIKNCEELIRLLTSIVKSSGINNN
jgi:four helix bundle protein